MPVPRPEPVDQARAALGERLFQDPRLSATSAYSCATCHPIDRGGMDGQAVSSVARTGVKPRNTPTIFNAALNPAFNWDGSATTLEEHTGLVVESLMKLSWPDLLARLRGTQEYERAFAAAYEGGLSRASVIDAIVTFERTLLTPDAPFDRFLRGDDDALDAEAKEGYQRFKAYGCAACHQGVNVGGNLYQRFGIFQPTGAGVEGTGDPGRYGVTGEERDRRVFRVPSLRNVALTAPYFHDGRARSLEQAVEVMGRHQLGRALGKEDVRLIVAFLHSLTGEYRGRPLAPSAGSRATPATR